MIYKMRLIEWEYDDSIGLNGIIKARFEDIPNYDDVDPANFIPSINFEVRFKPETVTYENWPDRGHFEFTMPSIDDLI